MEERIQIVTVDSLKYIVDNHRDDYQIVYKWGDWELTEPLGTYDAIKSKIDMVDKDDKEYQQLNQIHTEIRKIDSDKIIEYIKKLQMDVTPPPIEVSLIV